MQDHETRFGSDGEGDHRGDGDGDDLPFDASPHALRGRYLLGDTFAQSAHAGSPERAAAMLAERVYGPAYRVAPEPGSTHVWRVLDDAGREVVKIGFRLVRGTPPVVGQVYLY